MNAETNNVQYARTQLEESRRRLDSVIDRISETKQNRIYAAINTEDDEFVAGDEIKEIPEENREYVVMNTGEDKVMNYQGHIQNVIIDCQMAIELAVKSMFKAVGQDFDYSHGIGFGSHKTQNFNREVPADFPRGEDIVRAIFLTQLWEKFYEKAKYGAPELNVGPEVIFDAKDGERAINDASFCVELAEDLLDYVED